MLCTLHALGPLQPHDIGLCAANLPVHHGVVVWGCFGQKLPAGLHLQATLE